MVEQALYNQRIGGTVPNPPSGMEMQTGRTNNHISQISLCLQHQCIGGIGWEHPY
jgi:hypothetical protein